VAFALKAVSGFLPNVKLRRQHSADSAFADHLASGL
jgi:hypothetical protein